MNEDGQELLEEIDENGQPQQQRQIIVGGDNYIITQDGLAVQAVDGQQVIMCEVIFIELQLLPDNCQSFLATVSQKSWQLSGNNCITSKLIKPLTLGCAKWPSN